MPGELHCELGGEARLANAGRPKDRVEPAAPFLHGAVECLQQLVELLVAADEREVEPASEARRKQVDLVHPPPPDHLLFALHRDSLEGSGAHRVLDEWVRRLADDDLAGARSLLEPLCDYDRLTGDEAEALLWISSEHLSRVDADPRLQAQLGQCVLHLLRRADGPERVVLMHGGNAEHSHDLIPDELLHRSPMPLDDLPHAIEETGLDAAVGLWIPFREPRGVDQVAKEDRHGLPHFSCGRAHAVESRPLAAAGSG